jgi:hypothetical protein
VGVDEILKQRRTKMEKCENCKHREGSKCKKNKTLRRVRLYKDN